MVTKSCADCGGSFSYEPHILNDRELMARRYCDACCDRDRAAALDRERAEITQRRDALWQDICPPLYRKTDLARLPQSFCETVENWTHSPRGVGLIGTAGQGKTRSAFALLRRDHEQDRSCAAVSSTAFARLCIDQYSDDKDLRTRTTARLRTFRESDIILIDDLGKSKMTERYEMELFDLLEHRTSHEKPTLWTANARGDELLALMSTDRGEPILRRLAEFSEIVTA